MSYMAPAAAAAAADEVEMETREASPAHFLIKIDSFSLLDKHGIDIIESKQFVAGNHKWRLIIYPNGEDEEGYVSVYLAIAGTDNLPSNWEVNATFSICLFNHLSGNYSYSLGRARRFHALKQEWGFEKFISIQKLTHPSNGYIVDDNCVFGAEVLVNENKAITECLSVKSVDEVPYKREFRITNFSTLKEKWVSEKFTFGRRKWCIEVYPNGYEEEIGRNLYIFLCYVSNDCAKSERVRPCFTISIKDQSNDLQHHQMTISDCWFSVSDEWGYSFIGLSSLNDPKKGFIVNDCCLIEIELVEQAISS